MNIVSGDKIASLLARRDHTLVQRFTYKDCAAGFYYFQTGEDLTRLKAVVVNTATDDIVFTVPYRRIKRDEPIDNIASDIECAISDYFLNHCRMDEDIRQAMIYGDVKTIRALDLILYALLDFYFTYRHRALAERNVWRSFTMIHSFERVAIEIHGVVRNIWVERNMDLIGLRDEVEYAIITTVKRRGEPAVVFTLERPTKDHLLTPEEYLTLPENRPYLDLHYSLIDKEK